jgi:hypothetical protein
MVLNKSAIALKESPMKSSPHKEPSPVKKIEKEEPIKYSGKVPIQFCSLIFSLILLLVFMILAYAFMWFLIDDVEMVKHWFGSILGIYFVFVLLLDPLFVFVYSAFFSKMGPYSTVTKLMGVILLGNGHANVSHGILYDLN